MDSDVFNKYVKHYEPDEVYENYEGFALHELLNTIIHALTVEQLKWKSQFAHESLDPLNGKSPVDGWDHSIRKRIERDGLEDITTDEALTLRNIIDWITFAKYERYTDNGVRAIIEGISKWHACYFKSQTDNSITSLLRGIRALTDEEVTNDINKFNRVLVDVYNRCNDVKLLDFHKTELPIEIKVALHCVCAYGLVALYGDIIKRSLQEGTE